MKIIDLWKDKTGPIAAALGGLLSILFIAGTGNMKAVENTADTPGVADVNETHSLPPLTDSVYSSLPFINDTLCIINDRTNSLQPFINVLKELREGKDTVINIIHLGDSHIQAGYLSGQTMRMLQASFGNAGRGWIAPLKLSKANEPPDYFILSNIREWITGRCVQSKPKCPWGIGGIGIQTHASKIDFNLIIAPDNGAGYSFNKVLLYRDRNAVPMAPSHLYPDSVTTLSWGGEEFVDDIVVDTFTTAYPLDTLRLKSVGAGSDSLKTQGNRYYGFMLTNGNPGILYHAIGVNGARYVDYTDRSYIRRLAMLKPSLLIVSLGTNESYGRNFSRAQFGSQLEAFIRLVKEELPETALLITTPAESYKKTYRDKKRYYVRNDNISHVADVISACTREQRIACWDLFTITGGYNSCKKWFDAGMFGLDRIHFSRKGYSEQGALLYKALVRTCIAPDSGRDMLTADKEALSAENLLTSDLKRFVTEEDLIPEETGAEDSFDEDGQGPEQDYLVKDEYNAEKETGPEEEHITEESSTEKTPEKSISLKKTFGKEPAGNKFIKTKSGKEAPAKKEGAQDVE
jgi:lysophospholipase L1-like esterase